MDKIKDDAKKDSYYYWNCGSISCSTCKALKVDDDCSIAQQIDLVNRAEKLLGGEQE